jgi:hypothetical protein
VLNRFKHSISGEHLKASFSGAAYITVYVFVFVTLVSTASTVWAQRTDLEYPTHREIMAYMSSSNSNVAVIQSRQDQVLLRMSAVETVGTSNAERIAVLEANMSSLMKIAWATMFAVFAMLSKGIFEAYQRVNLANIRVGRKAKSASAGGED